MKTTVEINLEVAFDELSYADQMHMFNYMYSSLTNTDKSNFIQENIRDLHKDVVEEIISNLQEL